MRASDAHLMELLSDRAQTFDERAMAPYVAHFRERFGGAIAGIFFYGSRLAEGGLDRSARQEGGGGSSAGGVAADAAQGESARGSLYDFFVVFDDARAFHRTFGQRLLNSILSPNVYVDLWGAFGTKFSTTSLARFRREMSPRARDIYHAGRFGKRVALVYARDEPSRTALLEAWLSGMRALVARTLDLMPETFSFEEFLVEVLAISYRGEVRVEKRDKVMRQLEAERPFYEAVYRLLLEERVGVGAGSVALIPRDGLGGSVKVSRLSARWRRFWTRRWLARSRRRMFYRWPKMILTIRNWLDVVLAKIERATGVVLPLSPRQRRWPLIFGWGHFWRVWRRGLFKSPANKN